VIDINKRGLRLPNGCLIWTGANNHRYGIVRIAGKIRKVHRIAFERNFGPIPEGQEVCHICDNTLCFEPLHLFAGTHTDNMRDAGNKGRMRGRVTGTRNKGRLPYAIAEATRNEIRVAWAEGRSMAAVAKEYGTTATSVWRIVHEAQSV
jgi:hypothetical protein